MLYFCLFCRGVPQACLRPSVASGWTRPVIEVTLGRCRCAAWPHQARKRATMRGRPGPAQPQASLDLGTRSDYSRLTLYLSLLIECTRPNGMVIESF